MTQPITICMTTWLPPERDGLTRERIASECITSWHRNIVYDGDVHLHIGDDGTPDHEALIRLGQPWRRGSVSWSRQCGRGVGASLNAGLRHAHQRGPLSLYAVDDWLLTAPMDLNPWAELLVTQADIGMVRLGPPHPWLTGTIEAQPPGWILRLDRHHFAFAHRPALYHQRLFDHYGCFVEDVNAYDCEIDYNARFCAPVHTRACEEAVRSGHQCYEPAGCAPERDRGPSIVFALPSSWVPAEGSPEYADINPRERAP